MSPQRATGFLFLFSAAGALGCIAYLAVALSAPIMPALAVLIAPEIRPIVLPLASIVVVSVLCGLYLVLRPPLARRASFGILAVAAIATFALVPFLGFAACILAAPTAVWAIRVLAPVKA